MKPIGVALWSLAKLILEKSEKVSWVVRWWVHTVNACCMLTNETKFSLERIIAYELLKIWICEIFWGKLMVPLSAELEYICNLEGEVVMQRKVASKFEVREIWGFRVWGLLAIAEVKRREV